MFTILLDADSSPLNFCIFGPPVYRHNIVNVAGIARFL